MANDFIDLMEKISQGLKDMAADINDVTAKFVESNKKLEAISQTITTNRQAANHTDVMDVLLNEGRVL